MANFTKNVSPTVAEVQNLSDKYDFVHHVKVYRRAAEFDIPILKNNALQAACAALRRHQQRDNIVDLLEGMLILFWHSDSDLSQSRQIQEAVANFIQR